MRLLRDSAGNRILRDTLLDDKHSHFGGRRTRFHRALLGVVVDLNMFVMKKETKRPIPLHDYGHALQNAVSWMGDRYLLAEPVPRRSETRKPPFLFDRAEKRVI